MRRLVAAIALMLCGCYAASPGGYFDDHAFYAARQHYRVRYADGQTLLPSQWRLMNYQLDGSGHPTHALLDAAHTSRLEIDRDRDGRPDTLVIEPTHELSFENVGDTAEISIGTSPLDGPLAQRSLAELSGGLVQAMVTSHDVGKWRRQVRAHWAARVLEQGPVQFGTTEAYGTVFSVDDLDQAEGQLDRSVAMVSLVLARPTSTWSVSGAAGGPDDLPMVVVFVYVARPEVFDAERPTFEQLLDRTDFH